jgi:hypothetical protein
VPPSSPAFRWFLGGQTISLTGSAMAPVALAFGVLELTGSGGWLAVVTTSALVPMVATLLLGGGIADRYRRDLILARSSRRPRSASRAGRWCSVSAGSAGCWRAW